jgi:hypothetical protein
MEHFPHHYSRRPRVGEPTDSTLKVMLEELQKMESRLGDKIEGRCGGLERRVDEFEHCAEECLVSLEMAHMELEVGRTDLEKHVNGLALEVTRVNRFFEHEHVFNQQSKAGIIGSRDSSSSSGAAAAAAGGGQHPDVARREGPSQAPHGTSHHHTIPDVSEIPPDSMHRRVLPTASEDSGRSAQGRLSKLNFPVFFGEDPQLWKFRCENYFEMYEVE